MSGKKPLLSPVPPPLMLSPSILSSTPRSRRASTASSIAAVPQVDREHVAQALDKIHTSSKEEGVLTTFNDLAPPPESVVTVETKGLAGDLVQNGLSGLYSRLKEVVGVSGKEKDKDKDKVMTTPTSDGLGVASAYSMPRKIPSAPPSSKSCASSLQRADIDLATTTASPSASEFLEPSVSPSKADATSDGQAQQYHLKASSNPPLTSGASSKSGSSNRPDIPPMVKSTSAVATANVSNVSVFRDVSHTAASRPNDGSSLGGRQISTIKANDGQMAMPSLGGESAIAQPDQASGSSRSRREDGYIMDGSLDPPTNPVKAPTISVSKSSLSQAAPESTTPSAHTRLTARPTTRRPAVIDRINRSQPSESHSRSSSISRGTAAASPVNTSAHNNVHHESFSQANQHQRMKSGDFRIPGTTLGGGAPEAVSAKLESMRKQVLSKQFWMADEICKNCYQCGSPFTAFRRKHHCRTCGCIFDSGCTSIISGQRFEVQGTLRVCKLCLSIILQRQDANVSDESADDTFLPAIIRPNQSNQPNQSKLSITTSPVKQSRDEVSSERTDDLNDDSRSMTTPMMAIPATKRLGESSNRNSAVLEFDAPPLSRPSSSRSLRSVNTGRPQSSGHKRQHSKHNLWNRFKPSPDERAPFRKSASEEAAIRPGLPAFHDDNVIDPDLAQYMSEEPSDDEKMSIMGTIAGSDPHPVTIDSDRPNFGSYLGVGRRIRNRAQADKSISGFSYTSRGADDYQPRSSRRRNLSTSGHQTHLLRSPRPRAATIRGPSGSHETLPYIDTGGKSNAARLTRSSSMKGEKEPRLELNPASMSHVRKLLRQLLVDSDIRNVAAWEKALIPILLKCTSSVDPDIDRNDDIDIRHYVKLKKIPGGRPSDTTYVPGVIFTKKLALKSMPRRMSNPRVVIISFPIEYQRHQHLMSLGPVLEQEREFLKQLVNRIIALRPQLLLAEKGVSLLALQFLSEAGIAVAYNVKSSVLSAVSRCLETKIISSVDMLALPPNQFQTGKSAGFEAKTFVNEEVVGGKKTYIFLSSNQEELGCTIALRGAPTPILAKLKHITEFMVYVVYNLKLESCLMRDSLIQLPTTEDMNRISTQQLSSQTSDENSLVQHTVADDTDKQQESSSTGPDDIVASQTSDGSQHGLGGSNGKDVTKEQSSQPNDAQSQGVSLHSSHMRSSTDPLLPDDVPMPTFYSDMVAKYETKILSASPFVRFSQPYLLMNAREQERRLVYLKRLRDQDIVEERSDEEKPKPQKFQLIKPEMVHQTGQNAPRQIMEILHAVHDAEYDKALYNYQTQTRSWENYIQGNLDLFDPYAHQNIVVLHSVICTETKIPCVEPQLIALGFYDEHADHGNNMDPDCTLGQYIEDVCYGAESTCTSDGCDRKMYQHHRTYVHGEARLTVFIELEANGKSRGDNIMMWSYCKICKRETREVEMSRSTWKYSLGKYLELSFWSRGTHLVRDEGLQGWNCPHDHHRDHIRYFGLEDKIIRIHYDPIDLLEIIVPRARITWKVEHDLNMKNDIFTHCQDKWTRFTCSVKARLKAIRLDNIAPEKAESCRAEVDRLTKKIQDEHTSIIRKLQEKYMSSKYYEVIPFNVVLREMLVKVTEWDAAFAKFEADFLPSDKDIRRLTMIQLRKMFTDESKESLSSNEGSTEAIELLEKNNQPVPSEGTSKDSQPTEADLDIPQPESFSEKMAQADEPQEATIASTPGAILERVQALDLAAPSQSAVPSDQAREVTTTTATPMPVSETVETLNITQPVSSSPASNVPQISATDQAEEQQRPHLTPSIESASRSAAQDGAQPSNIANAVKVTPEHGPYRRAGSSTSPPMVRANSQPMTTLAALPRASSALSKRGYGVGKDKDRMISADAPTGNELRKPPTFSIKPHRKANPSSIPRFVGKKDKVITIRKHFEQLSREFEKEREKDRKKRAANMSQTRPSLQHSKIRATVEVCKDVAAASKSLPVEDEQTTLKEPPELSMSTVEPEPTPVEEATVSPESVGTRGQSPGASHHNEDITEAEAEAEDAAHNISQDATDDEQGDSDTESSMIDGSALEEIAESLDSSTEIPLELPKHEKMNFMKTLLNFWNERSASQWPPLDYPLNASDHIFIDSDIIVREDEPSSVIAFALSSEDYKDKLRRFHNRTFEGTAQSASKSEGIAEKCGGGLEEPLTDERLESSLVHNSSSHFKYHFSEGSAKMQVKIFYAEQFDALRRKCGVADRIVESLSRCVPWDSKGGKTRAVFLKTQDDRLVMKSLSQIETQAFLKFAPAYFSIMAEALFHDLPSVIAKMLGFFQVAIKNPVTGTEIKLDLLLMENLFYDREPTRIFDLKGSMRNRKIQSTGEQNEVLLDENMVEYIYESPLFAREHSKKLLRASVFNDTLFLARQEVMDYSLMIAVDEAKKELVVGIIDCIRTFTWDKKLESWIKDRGFAGGGRNRPTVTSPKEYKSRFREAMSRYILQAPNCWHLFNPPYSAPVLSGP